MMALRQFYLTKLIEECQEVAQRAAKSQQFGAEEVQTGQTLNNRQRLTGELNDLLVVVHILKDLYEINYTTANDFVLSMTAKKEKLSKYLKYSQELGMVEHD